MIIVVVHSDLPHFCICWWEPVVQWELALACVKLFDQDRALASVFFVNDVNSPGGRVQLIAGLRGGMVASLSLARDHGRGCFVRYKSAIARRVKVHVSDAFATKHGQINELITWACGLPGSLWARATAAGLLRENQGVETAIAVLTSDETAAFEKEIKRHVARHQITKAAQKKIKVTTKPEFFDLVLVTNPAESGQQRG